MDAQTEELDRQRVRQFFDIVVSHWRPQRALEAFARDGQLTLSAYSGSMEYVEAWELNPAHQQALAKLADVVRIGNSAQLFKNRKFSVKSLPYDMIVLDTPQGQYPVEGWPRPACEHFEFLPLALQSIAPGGLIVLYVNLEPYNREAHGHHGQDDLQFDHYQWMAARKKFYGSAWPSDREVLFAYKKLVGLHDRQVGQHLWVPCPSGMLGMPKSARLALEIL